MQPIEVTQVDMTFGGDMNKLLPAYNTIPEEFKNSYNNYSDFISHWFFNGLSDKDMERLTPKEGIDATKAMRHIAAIMRSWAPKHEHKTAGCAYLLSEFFTLASKS